MLLYISGAESWIFHNIEVNTSATDALNILSTSAHMAQTMQVNTLRPRQNVRCFADDTFKRIFMNENVRISILISLKFVPKGPINNNPALVQIMAWRRSGDEPLSEPVMVSLMTHICVTRPQWVKETLSSMRNDFNNLRLFSIEKWWKIQLHFYVVFEKLSMKRVNISCTFSTGPTRVNIPVQYNNNY